MPLNYESVKELRKRMRATKKILVERVKEFAENRGLKIGLTSVTLRDWERGDSIPNTKYIDLLYEFAYSQGYDDLEFYVKPNSQTKSNQQNNPKTQS